MSEWVYESTQAPTMFFADLGDLSGARADCVLEQGAGIVDHQ